MHRKTISYAKGFTLNKESLDLKVPYVAINSEVRSGDKKLDYEYTSLRSQVALAADCNNADRLEKLPGSNIRKWDR